ncbi:MAG TPA: hypothetical protein VKO67_10550, partial [Smithellaceae bacterium]|nr:hypothetical protein [Smithellaceae bacterium]
MQTWKKITTYACGILLLCAMFSTMVSAGGPPLKDKVCSSCHKDLGAIMPKKHPDVDKAAPCLSCHKSAEGKTEATKFSTQIHKLHQGEKT